MPRTYSKTGCIRCKLRKKKCSEERPSCAACVKWNWICEYDYCSLRPSTVAAPRRVKPHPSLPNRTLACSAPGESDIESMILKIIPDRIKIFYSPTSNHGLTDLRIMFQLMANNALLRHALVACFSVAGRTDAMAKLNRIAYGHALQDLRSKVLVNSLDQETRICVVIAIAFLGKMESFGPSSLADQLEHWVALIPLLESKEMLDMMQRAIIPFNEVILIFESLLYHAATDAIFSRKVERVWRLWRSYRTYDRICHLNPEGPSRTSLSPLLSGQYEIYDLALELTYLCQCREEKYVSTEVADRLEASIRRRDVRVDVDFAKTDCTTQTARHNALRVLYHSFCNALLIFITALREPSYVQRKTMKELVEQGVDYFSWRPPDHETSIVMRHANHLILAAIWPIQIVACAAYDSKQLEFFVNHFASLEKHLDPGHVKRTRVLFDRVSRLVHRSTEIDSPSDPDAPPLSPGLVLLRQGMGSLEPG